MNIKLLDCTLRDGGYINDWNFSNKDISKILNSLSSSDVDIIECGYLNNKNGKISHSTLFPNTQIFDDLTLKIKFSKVQKVVMINLGDFDVKKLIAQDHTNIDGIRLAFHKEKLEDALKEAKQIIKLGYKLFFQPMVTKNYTDLEFLSMIEKVNKLEPYSFYIVDSFGSMTLEEFHKYIVIAHNNLESTISLGYHSHNNMQLAFSNAVSMCSMNMKREIIIDASIYGIGRGAGNLNTELIADFLNKSYETQYNTLPLLEIIDELLNALMKKTPWGFSPAQFLSASFNCHPNYATYLINTNTSHIVDIKKILEKLPKEKKSSFNKKLIEQLYIDFILEEKTHIKELLDLAINKNILLIASGKSIIEYSKLLEKKRKNPKYILIGLNHIPKITCDYYFFTNQKRYDEFYKHLKPSQIVVSNNITIKNEVCSVLDFTKLAFVNNRLVINVSIACINYLISTGFKNVEVAGLDGYQINTQNYNYDETSYVSDTKALVEQNQLLTESLSFLKNQIDIHFLTPTILTKKDKFKIIGVIPARYKSSRFEGKPLCLIKDIPMLKRTYMQAKNSKSLDELIVATESEKIKEFCVSENIPVIMTSDTCLTGTDRIAEASKLYSADLYINIQGDEPVIDPKSIDEVASEYKIYGDKYIAYNLYKYIDEEDEVNSDTIIKVISNEKDELMYMSRLRVPFNKSNLFSEYKKQICVYGFTKQALEVFSNRDKTLNEQFEDIEILRFVDMGYKVKMKETKVDSIAVDVPSDVIKVENYLELRGLK